jgi:hypothetical protein
MSTTAAGGRGATPAADFPIPSKRMPEREGGETMQLTAQKITPCLWFDSQAEEAAK